MKLWLSFLFALIAVSAQAFAPEPRGFSATQPDGDGNRVKKTVSGSGTTYYLVDDRNPTGYAQVLEERMTLTGDPVVTYVFGLDLISQTRGLTTRYYGYDGQGTVRYLTDGSYVDAVPGPNFGQVTDFYTYDAFGILTAHSGTTVNHYRYAGEQWDEHLGMYYLRARYYHPDVGRFWTMDTYEGSQSDPLSLHKYLYAHADPVNNLDPSGHAITFDVMFGSTLANSLRASWERNRAPIYKGALLAALTVAGVYATTTVAEAIQIAEAEMTLAEAGTSVRNEIAKAAQILRTLVGNIQIPKIVPIPMSVIPNVAQNVAVGQLTSPGPLQRASITRTVLNRYNATKGRGSAGPGMSWDEYPFASTYQGGSPAVVRPVPAEENWVQGGIIAAAYAIEKISVGDWFTVVVTP
jgi:RHS repeat-associated protein